MSNSSKDVENGVHNDYASGNGANLEQQGSTSELRQMLTNNTMTDEQFERMFLSPRNQGVVGDLRKQDLRVKTGLVHTPGDVD